MISPFSRSFWPRGACPPGTPVGAKKFVTNMCLVSDSEGFGTGTASGNGWRKPLNQIALAAGITITWKGNQTSGDYVPTQKTQAVIAATIPDHLSTGSINTPQYFGAGQPLNPCDSFLILLGTNDGDLGPGSPNVVNYGANLAQLCAELIAKEPGATFGCAYVPRGGSVLRNAGVDDINATQVAAGVATFQGTGGLIALGDARVLTQAQAVSGLGGQGAQYLGTESPNWVHYADAGCIAYACAIWPMVCNMLGFNAVWPGEQVS
jgi:hypothetical protein